MVVDSASQVVRVPADQFAPPPPMAGMVDHGFLTGVGKMDEKLIITIHVNRILSTAEMSQITASLQTAEKEPALA
jgi:purine-binding chemotaxis protein CheW